QRAWQCTFHAATAAQALAPGVPRSWLQKQLTRAALDKVSWRERPVAHQCRAPAQGARACLVHSRRAGSKAQDEALSDITRVGDASCGPRRRVPCRKRPTGAYERDFAETVSRHNKQMLRGRTAPMKARATQFLFGHACM